MHGTRQAPARVRTRDVGRSSSSEHFLDSHGIEPFENQPDHIARSAFCATPPDGGPRRFGCWESTVIAQGTPIPAWCDASTERCQRQPRKRDVGHELWRECPNESVTSGVPQRSCGSYAVDSPNIRSPNAVPRGTKLRKTRAFKTACVITAAILVGACAGSPQLVQPTRVTVASLNDESLMMALTGEMVVTTGKIDCSAGPRRCVVSAPDSSQTTAALGIATDAGGSISDCLERSSISRARHQ